MQNVLVNRSSEFENGKKKYDVYNSCPQLVDVSSTFDRVVEKLPPRHVFKGSQSVCFAHRQCLSLNNTTLRTSLITEYIVVVLISEKLNGCYIG